MSSEPDAVKPGLAYLLEVVQELSLARSLEQVQAIVRTAARRITGCDGATFVLREGDACHYADEDAIAPLWKGRRFPLETCISGWSMLNRQAAVIPDIYADARIPHDAYRPTFVKSLVMVPIRRMEPIGAIGNYWAAQRQPTDEEVELLQALADSTSIALENVQVYAELEQRVRQRTAELERSNAELEQANRQRARFLATMSHEIRTPLNGIVGIVELLQEMLPDPHPRELLGIVQTSSAHLLNVINDILDFSKIDAGKLELDRHPFELRRCAEEALELVAHKASEKGLELALICDDEVPEHLLGDSNRVRQILANYLSNAVKFTSRGEIVVSVRSHRLQDGRHEVHVAVRDTGCGIPQAVLARLFRPFEQADAGTARRHGGTGLGLAISRQLAQLMGGDAWAESQPERGSSFHFTLRAPAVALPQRDRPGAQSALAGRRLLVVDDHATNRLVLGAAASRWDMLVSQTGSPRQALAWIDAGERFDAALIDHQMPEMNGPTLAAEIQRRCAMPLILVRSIGSHAVDKQGFAAVMSKPVRQRTLLDTLLLVIGPSAPVAGAAPLAQAVPEAAPALRILVAEDNPVNQKVAQLVLESLQCRADFVADGRLAVEAALGQAYDLILMDLQMPGMGGLEATRQIRMRQQAGAPPHIVAMTASAFDSDRDDCIAAGMQDFVSKPIQKVRLEQIIRQVAAGRAPA